MSHAFMDMFLLVCASNTGGMCTAAPISGAGRSQASCPRDRNAQVQAGPGEFGFGMCKACGVQTHAVVRAAAAKPGSAWIWALVGGARPAHSLCIMSIASDTLHEQLPVPLTLNTTGEYYTGMTES